ncbi:hypothetical protein MTX20_07985 [Bradyrhizobium sp. ISRA435]|nr:hypothetical protein MTX20_07985 [Bradyrhizobium sp. ISRA435]
MSSEIATIPRERASVFGEVPAWFLVACGVYALLLLAGSKLLADSDTYWQIAVGRWILDHGTVPSVDIYSFTKAGEPWMSSSWLSQVLYAKAYDLAGWAGPRGAGRDLHRCRVRGAHRHSERPDTCDLCERRRARRVGAVDAASAGAPACPRAAGHDRLD